jgi:hypothetical protein
VISVLPRVIDHQFYTLNARNPSLIVGPFDAVIGTGESYTLQDYSYSVFTTALASKFQPPLYCPTLVSKGTLQPLPIFINFD